MQFSLEERLEKRKRIHPTHHRYQSMDCVIKWGSRYINCIKKFFHLPQNFYHATEKTQQLCCSGNNSDLATPSLSYNIC